MAPPSTGCATYGRLGAHGANLTAIIKQGPPTRVHYENKRVRAERPPWLTKIYHEVPPGPTRAGTPPRAATKMTPPGRAPPLRVLTGAQQGAPEAHKGFVEAHHPTCSNQRVPSQPTKRMKTNQPTRSPFNCPMILKVLRSIYHFVPWTTARQPLSPTQRNLALYAAVYIHMYTNRAKDSLSTKNST